MNRRLEDHFLCKKRQRYTSPLRAVRAWCTLSFIVECPDTPAKLVDAAGAAVRKLRGTDTLPQQMALLCTGVYASKALYYPEVQHFNWKCLQAPSQVPELLQGHRAIKRRSGNFLGMKNRKCLIVTEKRIRLRYMLV